MRYITTIDLWSPGIQEALYQGHLKLQRGQWVTCGRDNPHKARFVSATPGMIWVVHWQGPRDHYKPFHEICQDIKRGLRRPNGTIRNQLAGEIIATKHKLAGLQRQLADLDDQRRTAA